ncbi:MAG: hypothetical protein M1820_009757 [Bogoriella megaspora]|nr:MAG: hypothetical protein M1820_009757 [Bogoriella megaspora]
MSATSYYNNHPSGPQPLKPMLLADSMSSHSGISGAKYDNLHHPNSSQEAMFHHDDQLEQMRFRDEHLKYRIRILKLVARIASFILSVTTLTPLSMTVHKYFSTRDHKLPVNGVERGPWNAQTKTWPTYMYIALAGVSTLFNLLIMVAYFWGIKQANRVSTVSGWFSGSVIVGHLVVWAVGASLYKVGKEEGLHARDLWGWSCSEGAERIQNVFANEVNFGRYCNVQTGVGILTVVGYFLAVMRMRSKKNIRKRSTFVGQRYERSREERSKSAGF